MRSFKEAAAMVAAEIGFETCWDYVKSGRPMPFEGKDDALALRLLEGDWVNWRGRGKPTWPEFLRAVITRMHEETP